MKKTVTAIAIIASMAFATASTAHASTGHDPHERRLGQSGPERKFGQLKRATATFQNVSNALAEGYSAFAIPPQAGAQPTTGLGLAGDPTCFDDPTGGMGVHYVKGIDETLNRDQPEALVYQVNEHGTLKLVGVEYIIPDNLVDPTNPPHLFGQTLHHHPYLPVYILHAWVWKANPGGMFADFNPRVPPCPAPTAQ